MTRHELRASATCTTPQGPLYDVYSTDSLALIGHIYQSRPHRWSFRDKAGLVIGAPTLPRLRTEILNYYRAR